MLSQLTAPQVARLLTALRTSYQLACEFDSRPGLKFLMQKVAHTPVAVNLYKQAGASMVFYIHTLIKICSHLPELDKNKVRSILADGTGADDKTEVNGINEGEDGKESLHDGAVEGSSVENGCEHFEKAGSNKAEESNGKDKVNSISDNKNSLSSKDKNGASDGLILSIERITEPRILDNGKHFIRELRSVCDELCQTYVDILYDTSGTSCVDSMADQQLFFLIAQPDEFPELRNARLNIAELNERLEQTTARLQGHAVVPTKPVSVQGER